MSDNDKYKLTIIMPALNEENNIVSAIEGTFKTLSAFGVNGEVVAINDGSTDATQNLIEEQMTKWEHLRLVNHDKPHGLGGSFWDGVDHAKGQFILCIPGDNENNLSEILRYFRLMEHVDIVIPFVYNKEVRTWFRRFLSHTYRLIINATFTVNLNYTNGTVLYRKSALQTLDYRSASFFFQTDILIRLLKHKYLFAEVPLRLEVRKGDKSKAVSFPSFLQVVKGYLKLVKDQYRFHKTTKGSVFPPESMSARRPH